MTRATVSLEQGHRAVNATRLAQTNLAPSLNSGRPVTIGGQRRMINDHFHDDLHSAEAPRPTRVSSTTSPKLFKQPLQHMKEPLHLNPSNKFTLCSTHPTVGFRVKHVFRLLCLAS